MPICPKCLKDRDKSQFANRGNGRKSSYCKECHRNYARAHYIRRKDYYRAKARKSQKIIRGRNREILDKYLLDHPCIDCGESDIEVLDFDHIDRDSKICAVSTMASNC